MTEINTLFAFLFLGILLGCMYSSYKIGFKEGTGSMIDFCKSKSKRGLVTMYFFGNNIEFLDTLDYNAKVLDAITKKLEDDSST